MSTACNPLPASGTQPSPAAGNNLANDAADSGLIPLSFGQQRLWFLDQLEPNSPLYNIPTLARITGHFDPGVLQRALNAIAARHDILRTRIICLDETPSQIIAENGVLGMRQVDLRDHAGAEQEAQRLVREEISRPFNLSTDASLCRA